MQPISLLADAKTTILFSTDLHRMQVQMVVASGVALLGLLVTTALAVYKPRSMTPYRWRKQYEERKVS